MGRIRHRRFIWSVLVIGLLGIATAGAALAAEINSGDVYRLPQGEVVEDDLYVSAGEIFIEGTVDGDLYAAGGLIEVSGEVTGDLVAAGGSIVMRGLVGDDVRVAGAGIDVAGAVADDLFVAGGGTGPGGFVFPLRIGGRTIRQGVRVGSAAQIGGDAFIVGGNGEIEGTVGGDLNSAMGAIRFGAQVAGDADLRADELIITPASQVNGTLTYATPQQVTDAADVAPDVVYEEVMEEEDEGNIVGDVFGWLLRTLLMLAGFALLGWLVLRYAPDVVTAPADAIAAAPVEAGLYGLVAAVLLIFIPILSALLVILTMLFWGVWPGIVLLLFLFGTLALFWFLSPLVTGLWLGRRIVTRSQTEAGALATLLIGVTVLVVLGRLPFLGWLIYLISFVIALGGVLRFMRSTPPAPEAQPTAVPSPS